MATQEKLKKYINSAYEKLDAELELMVTECRSLASDVEDANLKDWQEKAQKLTDLADYLQEKIGNIK